MVIAQIEGGLASQMFGYAAARRLALVHGVDVLIDQRNFRTYKKFDVELHHWNVDAILLSYEQADEICGLNNELLPVVQPNHLHFDKSILEIYNPRILMRGNYVCEDYFFDIADVLREDFTRVTPPTRYAVETQAHLTELSSAGYQPVAVHIRHGDYVQEAHVNQAHGVCTLEYYTTAMALMRKTVQNPWFVFFSNDPDWTEKHFSGFGNTVTRPPGETPPIEDMVLMAQCQHNIIANSGYSWWGAWLNNNSDKVVIGPRPFMADRSFNTEDILLRDWISLSTNPRPATETKPRIPVTIAD